MTELQWNGENGERWVASQALLDATMAPYADALLEAASLPESGAVVDVGCGCGATTLMAARGRPNLRVVGVDPSGPMLARARERARAEGLPIRFEQGDAAVARPLPDGADRVLSRFGVMFFDDPVAAFGNMRRWLRPGGMLAATVWGTVADNEWIVDIIEQVRRHLDVPDPETTTGPFSLADPQVVDRLLTDAGFARHEQRALDLPMRIACPVEDAVRFHCDRSIVRRALHSAPATTRDAAIEGLRAYVEANHDGEAMTLGASARLVRAWV